MLINALKTIGLYCCLLTSPVWGQSVGTVTHLSGVLTTAAKDGPARLLSVNSDIRAGETLATQDKTYARIKFQDGGEVVLRPNSQFALESFAYQPDEPQKDNFVVGLLKGGLRMVTGLVGKRNPHRVHVNTLTATVGIRGTHFGLLMCQADCTDILTDSGQPPLDGLHIDVASGVIFVKNQVGEQLMSAGQFGHVPDLRTAPRVVPPREGIQVTMPQNISLNSAAGRSVGSSQDSECTVP